MAQPRQAAGIQPENRRRESWASSLRGGGSGSESEGESSEEDDFDDISYGTMARFVPTLVLERLRNLGEAAMANKQSSSAEPEEKGDADRADGANSPKVLMNIESRRWDVFFSSWLCVYVDVQCGCTITNDSVVLSFCCVPCSRGCQLALPTEAGTCPVSFTAKNVPHSWCK